LGKSDKKMKTLEQILFELTSDYLSEYDAAILACMIAGEVKKYYKYFFLTGMAVGVVFLVIILKWLK